MVGLPAKDNRMGDVAFVVLASLLFAAAAGYVGACRWLLTRQDRNGDGGDR